MYYQGDKEYLSLRGIGLTKKYCAKNGFNRVISTCTFKVSNQNKIYISQKCDCLRNVHLYFNKSGKTIKSTRVHHLKRKGSGMQLIDNFAKCTVHLHVF